MDQNRAGERTPEGRDDDSGRQVVSAGERFRDGRRGVPGRRQCAKTTRSYHAIPYHTMPCQSIPYHTMPCHTIACHPMPCHTISWHAMPSHAMPYHLMSVMRDWSLLRHCTRLNYSVAVSAQSYQSLIVFYHRVVSSVLRDAQT